MARRLKFTVAVGGNVYPAGTEETVDLSRQITNDAAWEGKADKQESKDSGEAKSSRSRKS